MIDNLFAYVILTVGSALVAYATFSRLLGFHRPSKWIGGGEASFTGEAAIGVFFFCGGMFVLHNAAGWIFIALAAWVVGYLSQRRANRQHVTDEEELRSRNSANFPGVFDQAPPEDLDGVHGDELDLFDAGACSYLGRVAKHDLTVLIDRFEEMSEQGSNDVFLIPESLEVLPQDSLSSEFLGLLQQALEHRDFLVLRWMPAGSGRLLEEHR